MRCVLILLRLAIAVGLLMPLAASAIYLRQFTPQGEVRDANRATAVFSGDMVKLGETDGPAPFSVDCPAGGSGRWSDQRTWTYSFARDLEPGERCVFRSKPEFKALNGEGISGRSEYAIFTPGPWIGHIQPYQNSLIEEDQVFLIAPRMPVKPESVEAHAWCESEGVGERLPLKVLPDAELRRILSALHQGMQQGMFAAQCANRLPPGAKMKLVWGKGVESVSGAVVRDDDTYNYQVRVPFRAEFTCEREKPAAPCSPLSDLRLTFTERVSWAQVSQIRLVIPKDERKPWRAQSATEDDVDAAVFKGPFVPGMQATLRLPKDLTDLSGRALTNAGSFPLTTRTGQLPPLAKFSAPFGILELKEGGVLPVTLRNVEARVAMRVTQTSDAVKMIATWNELHMFESQTRQLPRPATKRAPDAEEGEEEGATLVDTLYPRELSFLDNKAAARDLPKPNGAQAFEVVGIPLPKPGFYVVELESRLLGSSLLAAPKPMYVRTAALVTDMAVHFKKGKDNSLAWVTSLSSGKPVAGVEVHIFDCKGQPLWHGKTDLQGRALAQAELQQPINCSLAPAFFVTARHGDDFSFVRSDWNRGVEPWRFNVDTWDAMESPKIHTILDRTLLRAGETVSMKHIARIPNSRGFAYPDPAKLPKEMTIALVGGEESHSFPLQWDARGVATGQWKIPETAKLGTYEIKIGGGWQATAQFRVSEFRLPAYAGGIRPTRARFGAANEVPLELSLAYLNGGGASGQKVEVSGLLERTYPHFPLYKDFDFSLNDWHDEHQLVADKIQVTLDPHGLARSAIKLSSRVEVPMHLLTEMTFPDPSGEIQTIAGETELWPAKVAVGVRLQDWVKTKGKRHFEAVVLDLDGKPVADAPVKVSGTRKVEYVHRKRIIGGFYSYERETHDDALGTVCQGQSDARGFFACDVNESEAGRISLVAHARDGDGNVSQAEAIFWSSGDGDIWFDQEDLDRMEVVPEKREYQPGETARLQIRSPFREATALVAVEREGIVETFVQQLSRRDPVVEIPVKGEWGPNVYVSVLAVRGRLREIPWYSFFQWGWRTPVDWFKEWRGGALQPTALVDLARPAWKFGLTEIQIGRKGLELKVGVTPDRKTYAPRAVAKVKVRVALPDGKPAPAGAEVALAAVDRALLELAPNDTWKVLDAMIQHRAYQVETSTAQMQVVGKRHYGKKALPAGGGGGKLSTRELFDTLLYWNPRVKLDARGEATVNVPLNDSLTAFKLVAVADVGPGQFGTGEAEIVSKQDLQIVSGLPPLVRELDGYRAAVTVRNGSDRPLQVAVAGHAGAQLLSTQNIKLEPGAAQEVAWLLAAPEGAEALAWLVEAKAQDGKAGDRIKLTQKIAPRVPVTVQQATLLRLEAPYSIPAAPPAGAIPGKGGVEVTLSASLSGQTAGLRRYFETYPYSCLEQKVSTAVGLHDAKRWQEIATNIDGYLDVNGFAQYFPGLGQGSDALTAHVLAVAHEAGFKLPDEAQRRMEQALVNFVEGRVKPSFWAPREILPERRLHALETLARLDRANARMLGVFEFKPIKMATTSLIDWYSILRRVPDAPEREARLAQVERELRNRMSYAGGRLMFTTEQDDYWWWLMMSGEVNALRLLDAAMDDPAWRDDMPALLRGALMRQSGGHWNTTVANVWGALALNKFGQRFEAEAVSGKTTAALEPGSAAGYTWLGQDKAEQGKLALPWAAAATAATPASFKLVHQGSGKPWVSLMVSAAVPGKEADSGFRITRSITPVEQKLEGLWSRGDIVRVRVEVEAAQSLSWVALSDPTPGGASILGNTARDSAIAREGENYRFWQNNDAWPAFTERGFGYFRAYYDYVPKGHFWLEYTMRLNNVGEFSLPATRVEAMYAPEIFGELPNEKIKVEQRLFGMELGQ